MMLFHGKLEIREHPVKASREFWGGLVLPGGFFLRVMLLRTLSLTEHQEFQCWPGLGQHSPAGELPGLFQHHSCVVFLCIFSHLGMYFYISLYLHCAIKPWCGPPVPAVWWGHRHPSDWQTSPWPFRNDPNPSRRVGHTEMGTARKSGTGQAIIPGFQTSQSLPRFQGCYRRVKFNMGVGRRPGGWWMMYL